MKGGKLIPENDWIAGNPVGSQPLIEVNAGTLILGDPDGTAENDLMTYGSAPFVGVTGTGRVIVEPGNTFNQITSSLTAQPAGTTTTALVSSSPTALPGQAVTLTATVTAAAHPRRRLGGILRQHDRRLPGDRRGERRLGLDPVHTQRAHQR